MRQQNRRARGSPPRAAVCVFVPVRRVRCSADRPGDRDRRTSLRGFEYIVLAGQQLILLKQDVPVTSGDMRDPGLCAVHTCRVHEDGRVGACVLKNVQGEGWTSEKGGNRALAGSALDHYFRGQDVMTVSETPGETRHGCLLDCRFFKDDDY